MTVRNRIKELDRALHGALSSIASTRFPNPERKDCPPSRTLRKIASRTLPITDPAIDHVAHCSPCFNELHEMRAGMRRRRMAWSAAAVAAVVVAALALGYLALWPTAPIDPTPEVAILDLRGLSPTRGEVPEPGATSTATLFLPRRVLDLTVQLPVGSAEGAYEVAIQQGDDPLLVAAGAASIENLITTLRVRIDTRELTEGAYQFAVRENGLNWRFYPLSLE
jgi:hypothetical protein